MRSVKDHTKDQCQLDILENVTGQNASFEAQQWTKAVDRDGLVHIRI